MLGLWSIPFGAKSHLFFVHPFFLFFALSAPPFPTQFSSPKSPLSGTSDLLFVVEKWQPAGAGFWGRFWTGSLHRKKRKILFFWRAKKGEKWLQTDLKCVGVNAAMVMGKTPQTHFDRCCIVRLSAKHSIPLCPKAFQNA